MSKTRNQGEKAEPIAIRKCLENKNNTTWCCEKFGLEASDGIEIIHPETKEIMTEIDDDYKAGRDYKADVCIRFIKTNRIISPSIKAIHCADPSFLNHTNRAAKVFQNGELKSILPMLDEISNLYKKRRNAGEANQDQYLFELLENSEHLKRATFEILKYWTFKGTGGGISKCQADSIILWDGNDITFEDCRTDEQKEKHIKWLFDQNLYKISFRSSRGMPEGGKVKEKITSEMMPWVYEWENDGCTSYKGAIHIRLVKPKKKK